MGFAVKDAIDMKIKEIGNEEDAGITIDYLNDCAINLKGDAVYAKKKGNNAISFSSAREGIR